MAIHLRLSALAACAVLLATSRTIAYAMPGAHKRSPTIFVDTDGYFPSLSDVGHIGPTQSGAEAFAIQTAPVSAPKLDVYPLVGPADVTQSTDGNGFDPKRSWGNLSPWFSVGSVFGLPNASPQVPRGCEITQMHLLHRHGARYPTEGSGPTKLAALFNASSGFSASGPLEFLNTWTYKLGAEILTPFGRQQLFDLGVAFRLKYGHLLTAFTHLPVFRTISQARMYDSSLHFAIGFFGAQEYQTSYHQLITIEDEGFNNTLGPWAACPNSNLDIGNIGGPIAKNWSEVFLKDTVKRLQAHMDGVDLKVTNVLSMMQLCAYETVALGYSEFCPLFTEEEWKGFQYFYDLTFWYSIGPGNPTTSAQGIGYVQELVARLTRTPITEYNTSLNSTIDGSNITFPLDQPIYVDATHDIEIAMILTALNFTTLAANGPLPVDHIPKYQTYTTQHIAPFAANLVTQVMSCPIADHDSGKASFIRFVLNDGVLPLTGLNHCKANEDGLCPLDDFLRGAQERIAEVDFEHDCFSNYTVPIPPTIIDGRAPAQSP